MEFTKNELKEIEKIFDIQAGYMGKFHAELITSFDRIKSKKKDKFMSKLFNEMVDVFDTYRTISAKASRMKGKEVNLK